MSTDLATMPIQPVTQIDHATLEKLVAKGDLAGLTAQQRTAYYQARCNAAGLDPASQPFEYLVLNGKTVLYAKKTATDQLTRLHKISIQILDRRCDPETMIYEVTCRATFPDGRIGEDVAALHLGRLQGEALSNAIMKCVTKAKRRTVLAACGLGMLDESEVDNIPSARRVAVHLDPDDGNLSHIEAEYEESPAALPAPSPTGPGSRMFTKEHVEKTKEFNGWLSEQCKKINAAWAAEWKKWIDEKVDDGYDAPAKIDDVINPWQAKGHLLKWAVESERLDPTIVPEEARTRQADALVALVYYKSKTDRNAIVLEMGAYLKRQRELKSDAIYRKFPHLAPDGYAESKAIEADESRDITTPADRGDAYEDSFEADLAN